MLGGLYDDRINMLANKSACYVLYATVNMLILEFIDTYMGNE